MLNCSIDFKENCIIGTACTFRCVKESVPW